MLTGAGTSAFIGECLAPALQSIESGWVSAVSTTDIVAGPANYLVPDVPTLLVSFARSGNSPESMAAVELAQQCLSECYHLIVTCNAKGALHQRGGALPNACVLLLPEDADDRGFAMTSSFSGMLLAAARYSGCRCFMGPGLGRRGGYAGSVGKLAAAAAKPGRPGLRAHHLSRVPTSSKAWRTRRP